MHDRKLLTTEFFAERMKMAFPGTDGMKVFESKEGIERLAIFFSYLNEYISQYNNRIAMNPVVMKRDQEFLINRFEVISPTRCLIGTCECEIEKVIAFRNEWFTRDCIYVEVKSDVPPKKVGDFEERLQQDIKNKGYYHESYRYIKELNTYITEAEYSDQLAEIDGELVKVEDAESRRFFHTKYNFLIAPKFSRFDIDQSSPYFDAFKKFFDELLQYPESLEQFEQSLSQFPFHEKMVEIDTKELKITSESYRLLFHDEWNTGNNDMVILAKGQLDECKRCHYRSPQTKININGISPIKSDEWIVNFPGKGEAILSKETFELFFRLAVGIYEAFDCKTGRIIDEGFISYDRLKKEKFLRSAHHAHIQRLRDDLERIIGNKHRCDFIQTKKNNVRISLHPRCIDFDWDNLRNDPQEKVRELTDKISRLLWPWLY